MKCDKTSFHVCYANDIKRNSPTKPVKRQETSGCSLKYLTLNSRLLRTSQCRIRDSYFKKQQDTLSCFRAMRWSMEA